MKIKIIISILAIGLSLRTIGQNTLELTYTAIDSAAYVQLDSIKVMNRTQGGDTVLFYPDTVLVLDYQVGISESNISVEGFQVFQNYPNPVKDQTTISFYIPEKDKVSLIATDMLGRTLIKTDRVLEQGYHSYRFILGDGSLFIFTVQWRENISSIKILPTNSLSNNASMIEYLGSEDYSPQLKTTISVQDFLFSLGDELLYIGYFDTLQSGMLDAPEESQTYTFQFATNIPCPGTPTVTYEGQVYNTIQIFSQCWLKENLNVGMMIHVMEQMTNNDTIEKHCYNNEPDSCAKYGGLYKWDEMMQYTTQQGTQGICPQGWHLPSDEEWKVLEGVVDSQHGIGDNAWDNGEYRGYDAGTNLKTTSGWLENGNGTDLFGYSGMPGGGRISVFFLGVGAYGYWWTSTEYGSDFAWYRFLEYGYPGVTRAYSNKGGGHSVRCLRD